MKKFFWPFSIVLSITLFSNLYSIYFDDVFNQMNTSKLFLSDRRSEKWKEIEDPFFETFHVVLENTENNIYKTLVEMVAEVVVQIYLFKEEKCYKLLLQKIIQKLLCHDKVKKKLKKVLDQKDFYYFVKHRYLIFALLVFDSYFFNPAEKSWGLLNPMVVNHCEDCASKLKILEDLIDTIGAKLPSMNGEKKEKFEERHRKLTAMHDTNFSRVSRCSKCGGYSDLKWNEDLFNDYASLVYDIVSKVKEQSPDFNEDDFAAYLTAIKNTDPYFASDQKGKTESNQKKIIVSMNSGPADIRNGTMLPVKTNSPSLLYWGAVFIGGGSALFADKLLQIPPHHIIYMAAVGGSAYVLFKISRQEHVKKRFSQFLKNNSF